MVRLEESKMNSNRTDKVGLEFVSCTDEQTNNNLIASKIKLVIEPKSLTVISINTNSIRKVSHRDSNQPEQSRIRRGLMLLVVDMR